MPSIHNKPKITQDMDVLPFKNVFSVYHSMFFTICSHYTSFYLLFCLMSISFSMNLYLTDFLFLFLPSFLPFSFETSDGDVRRSTGRGKESQAGSMPTNGTRNGARSHDPEITTSAKNQEWDTYPTKPPKQPL